MQRYIIERTFIFSKICKWNKRAFGEIILLKKGIIGVKIVASVRCPPAFGLTLGGCFGRGGAGCKKRPGVRIGTPGRFQESP